MAEKAASPTPRENIVESPVDDLQALGHSNIQLVEEVLGAKASARLLWKDQHEVGETGSNLKVSRLTV